ncbi:MAG: arginine--tRNA ligase, partial [bacterium]
MSQNNLESLLKSALEHLGVQEALNFSVTIPPKKDFGHYATNVAILAARFLKQNPLIVAEQIKQKIKELDKVHLLADIQVAKPGFINFFLTDSFLQHAVLEIVKQDHDWGKSKAGHGEKILLEYVSANPTGPLHIGHGRWAVIGDVIARLLLATGAKVSSEYYINNVGKQINLLYASVEAARENIPTPEGGYGGAYIKEIAKETFKDNKHLLQFIIDQQKETLAQLNVKFDQWFFESELHKEKKVAKAIEELKRLGRTFEEGGALWFKSEDYGDDKNRVIIRENGETTYFAA